MSKVRRIDYSADEMIAGVAGQLDPVDFGIYWMICTLIYSRGGPIADDHIWISGLFKKTHPRTTRAAIERLVASGKIERSGAELMVNRCRSELERASNRTRTWAENGAKGGRPLNKNNNIDKPKGFSSENRASNHQLSTINNKDSSLRSESSYHADFETAWKEYPRREGGNPKKAAYAAWNARLKSGHTSEQMTDGVRRYASYVARSGTHQRFVMQAQKFFGPEDPPHFTLGWETSNEPANHSGRRNSFDTMLDSVRSDYAGE